MQPELVACSWYMEATVKCQVNNSGDKSYTRVSHLLSQCGGLYIRTPRQMCSCTQDIPAKQGHRKNSKRKAPKYLAPNIRKDYSGLLG